MRFQFFTSFTPTFAFQKMDHQIIVDGSERAALICDQNDLTISLQMYYLGETTASTTSFRDGNQDFKSRPVQTFQWIQTSSEWRIREHSFQWRRRCVLLSLDRWPYVAIDAQSILEQIP
jgi:hypothetical protein